MTSILLDVFIDAYILIVFPALLGLVWAYFLFTHKRGNSSANRFLALLVVVLSILILRQTASFEVDKKFSLFLYFISQGLLYLLGPSIYFHIKNLAGDKLSIEKVFYHFIPAAATTIIMAILFLYRIEIRSTDNISLLKISSIIFISLQIIHLLFYLFYSRRLVSTYEKKLANYYSSLSKINLKWMKQLTTICTVFAAIILGMYLLIISGGYYTVNNNADFLFLALTALIIISIIVRSWKQPEIVSGLYQETNKYKTSPLSQINSTQLKTRLEELIYNDKIYLIPELTLNQLADSLSVPPYIVSQLINQEYNLNFFNFINQFRIDFAVDKIQKGELAHSTLVGIAYDSGFNSKSTFNRAFKKKMGRTPKEFSRQVIVNN